MARKTAIIVTAAVWGISIASAFILAAIFEWKPAREITSDAEDSRGFKSRKNYVKLA